MKLEIKRKRISLLARIDRLERERCEKCKGSSIEYEALKCKCAAAVEIRKIGKELIGLSGTNRNSELDKLMEDVKRDGLTLANYTQLREAGILVKQIRKALDMSVSKFQQWRFDNGLTDKVPYQSQKPRPDPKFLEEQYYTIALENGVDKELLETRIYYGNWELKDAISTPPASDEKTYKEWRQVAVQNGIHPGTFESRMRSGMTLEVAATRKTSERTMPSKFDKKWMEVAEKNGVSYHAFAKRVSVRKWSQQKAATTPPMGKSRKKVEA